MKTAFVIRGFTLGRTAASENYAELRDMLAGKGYHVVPVDIFWNRTVMSDFVDKFVALYQQKKGTHNIVIGNSFGAMAAFIAAPQVKPDKLVLCSLSPFFQEDLRNIPDEEVLRMIMIGKRRLADFRTISANDIAAQVNAANIPAVLLYGKKEQAKYPHLVARVKDTARQLEDAQLIQIPGAAHKMREPHYLAGLQKVV